MAKKVLIMAGGGGHTGYGYALAQRLYGMVEMHFLVPRGDLLSQKRLSKFGSLHFLLKSREAKTPLYEFIPKFAKAFIESNGVVPKDLDVAISTGSNFCIPPSMFAWMKGIPLINIESCVRFTKPTKTALLLQPFSAITALHWTEQKKILKRGIVVGPLLPKPEVNPWNGGYILVTGGTFGHKKLFDVISESKLENVVLQTGKINPEPYRKRHPEWKVIDYSTEFYKLVAGADVVVTHFGSSVLEAFAYGKPIVVVPNPEWMKRTVGYEDATYLIKKVNAVLVSEITVNNLLNAIDKSKDLQRPKYPDGAENLANIILRL